MKKPMWMVRAAKGGRLADEFVEQGVVAIGWDDLGNLANYSEKSKLMDAYKASYPGSPEGRAINAASQLLRFRDELQIGDKVITYDSSGRIYHVGTITGSYRYSENMIPPYVNVRNVTWEGQVDRDKLSVGSRNSLGPTLTLFRVSDQAAAEIETLREGKAISKAWEPDEEIEEENLLESYRAEAFEIIKDRLNRLSWDDMQEFVAGLLRAMGYKTKVSDPGPDRGVDIMASPDGFGFESPRIMVEVKHRNQAIGAPEIRSFVGGRHKDDKGLYVSTGGFSREARYEAERANIPLTLMDLDTLVKAIFRSYDNMDMDTQKLLPLKKIYWPL